MPRKKVNLQYIANDAIRRTTFKKRRRGLIKKLSELSILCDVKACAVIYEPGQAQPEVWPNEQEAKTMLQGFKAVSHMENSKKMMDQEGFLRQRVTKQYEQLRRSEKEIRELEMTRIMYEAQTARSLDGLAIEQVLALYYHIDGKKNAVVEKINTMKEQMALVDATTEGLAGQTKCYF